MVVAPGLRLKQLCPACGGNQESTEVAGLTGTEMGGRGGSRAGGEDQASPA